MEPVYLDLHIHTSLNPNELDENYDVELLKKKIDEFTDNSISLISLTDHNTINTDAYLNATLIFDNLLLGTELHVRHHDSKQAYHCHMYFKSPNISRETINPINKILDKLYPQKELSIDDNIPKLEDITTAFDSFEFLLLPHAGQSHSTFNKSVEKGTVFDKTIERKIYYNHFDGFTARSESKRKITEQYLSDLGISDFMNLITSSDNYHVNRYPDPKAKHSEEFVPTWMFALPTYDGLRLSLSESSRLEYGGKPDIWNEYIRSVKLNNEYSDIDVHLTPGLNVVIGGSSSGKTLLVDSIYRSIGNDFSDSPYKETKYSVKDILVNNPAELHPHYINQNFIMKVCDQNEEYTDLPDIELLKRIFPDDSEQSKSVDAGLGGLRKALGNLINAVEGIEEIHGKLDKILPLSRLILTKKIDANPLLNIIPKRVILEKFSYAVSEYDHHIQSLEEIESFLQENPLVTYNPKATDALKKELRHALDVSNFELKIRQIIKKEHKEINRIKTKVNKETATKSQNFDSLTECIRDYFRLNDLFYKSLKEISNFSVKIETQKVKSMGHELSIQNNFELTGKKFLEVINSLLKMSYQIKSFNAITPESLFKHGFKHRDPKVITYDDFKNFVNSRFGLLNKKNYKIITKDGKDYDELSAGYKTSIILDLVLGSTDDIAPLIIDQPEDNLATSYINKGLINAIKECKTNKQIILVSHNATIPMLGDAQNVIFCQNTDNIIFIRSSPLEGVIEEKSVVDIVAEETDGGKASIKKRVKKYNLKQFRGY